MKIHAAAVPNVAAGATRVLWILGALTTCTLLSLALVRMPWVTAGLVLGGAVFAATLQFPLVVATAMLVLGPIDLSFMTGGFKSLLEDAGGLDMNGIRLIGVVIALSAVAMSDRHALNRALGPFGRWYLLFLLFAAASLAWSASLVDGLRLLLKLAYPFLIFITFLAAARSRREIERAATWVLMGAAAIALVLIPLLLALGAYVVELGRVQIPLVGRHQNPMSFYLLAMTLMAFARFTTRGQVRYLGLCVAFTACMALAMTRITLLATVTGLIGIALYSSIVTRNYRAVAVAAIAGACIAFALAPVALERTFGFRPSFEWILDTARDPMQLYRAMNWQGRELLWPVIFAAFLSSPFLGLGIGSSTATLLAQFPAEWGLVVHNEYLRLAADTGLIGVGLFAFAVSRWWWSMTKLGRTTDGLMREFTLPAFAAVLAWAVISLTDNSFDYYSSFTQYVGFLCAGAIALSGMPPASAEPAHAPAAGPAVLRA